MKQGRALAWVGALAAFLAGQHLAAQAPARTAQLLGQLSPGRWELRVRDSGAVRPLCLGDTRAVVQLHHRGLACEWIVLEDSAAALTVQYTCKGHGFGRTHIRRETAQLIQLETQGIVDGVPFDERVEGRRTGECGH